MTSRSRDIIFLLGAGASAEAGIPVSAQMINLVEKSLTSDAEKSLYQLLRCFVWIIARLWLVRPA
jgi:NAD-dependent SIR2 family protein deacetylase